MTLNAAAPAQKSKTSTTTDTQAAIVRNSDCDVRPRAWVEKLELQRLGSVPNLRGGARVCRTEAWPRTRTPQQQLAQPLDGHDRDRL